MCYTLSCLKADLMVVLKSLNNPDIIEPLLFEVKTGVEILAVLSFSYEKRKTTRCELEESVSAHAHEQSVPSLPE